MNLTDALAAALHERYEPIEGGSTGILTVEKYGYSGRCRACGKDGVWSKSIDAAAILADPAFREALTAALAEAINALDTIVGIKDEDYPAAIVARLLPAAVEEALA